MGGEGGLEGGGGGGPSVGAKRLQLRLNVLRIRIGEHVMRTIGFLITFETQKCYCDSRSHWENAEFWDLVECPSLSSAAQSVAPWMVLTMLVTDDHSVACSLTCSS